jgi:hypothetical protein
VLREGNEVGCGCGRSSVFEGGAVVRVFCGEGAVVASRGEGEVTPLDNADDVVEVDDDVVVVADDVAVFADLRGVGRGTTGMRGKSEAEYLPVSTILVT